MTRQRIPNLGGARAVILHRPHDVVDALARQLSAIGLVPEPCWPDLPASVVAADFLFFDADMGFDAQFPWAAGAAPLPTIMLIGSEAPGRIEWALSREANAQLLKPVGSAGVYSSLLIARQTFERRMQQTAEIETLRERVAERQTIVRAVAVLGGDGGEEAGFDRLRHLAMDWRVTMEEAAARVMAASGEPPRTGPAKRRAG
ncbi:ANTAR domain-containing response regulator [Pararhizobium mangrovi]|uniref:ANTAR domain-containing protein n=1 Tax=Pararhizobium mangrovi TaxID=2590452 RepID=A0A506U842_9HYPH|nr:ANTAR domain-containing protein [Pararhizobium mangrovi]TPW29648.1 ANTAR domain-containing protein [Pararhizobium mangrovi]